MKPIWTLTEEEKNTIEVLYEKKIALENLAQIIDPENSELRAKFEEDYGKVLNKFQSWWRENSEKYYWEKGQNWYINFATCEVFLQE